METQINTLSNFTRGPWQEHPVYAKSQSRQQIVTGDDGKRWLSNCTKISRGDKIVCEVSAARAIDDVDFGFPKVEELAEFEANVRLIAASPELFSALTTALSALRSYQYGNSSTELAEEVANHCESILRKVRTV